MAGGKIIKRRTIHGIKYEIESFHPLAFESGAYVVRFHQAGMPRLDRYGRSTVVRASSPSQAIELAIDSLF